MLEVKSALADWLWWDDMAGDVSLKSIAHTNFKVVSLQALEVAVLVVLVGHFCKYLTITWYLSNERRALRM